MNHPPRRSLVVWIAALVAVSLVATACGDDGVRIVEGSPRPEKTKKEKKDKVKRPPVVIEIDGQPANDEGSLDLGEAEPGEPLTDFELDEYSFEPTVLVGRAGQVLEINMKNDGDVRHTFTLDEQDIDVELEANATQAVTVTFPPRGFVLYYCRFHADQGMRGALSVGDRLGSRPIENR